MSEFKAPSHVWIGYNEGVCDFEWFTDVPEDAEHADVEYIRKDKYEELMKAADELADAVEQMLCNIAGVNTKRLVSTLSAYRKATGDT